DSRRLNRSRLLRVQLHQDPRHAAHHARHGCWCDGSAVGSLRLGSLTGSLGAGVRKSCVELHGASKIDMRCCAFLFAVIKAIASTVAGSPPRDNASIVGVWRAQENDLPAATLTITDETGRLAGAVLSYLIRHDEGKAP